MPLDILGKHGTAGVPAGHLGRSTEETVYFPSFGDECAFDLVTLAVDNQWGRVSGMNGFGDREKAQTLTFTGSENYRVVGAMVWFERPAIDGNGTVILKVYEPSETDGRPERLLGQSDALQVSEVVVSDSTPQPTIFTFDQSAPVLVSSPNFILSCDFFNLYQTFDTLVLLQTISECGDGADTWELLADGQIWLNIASEFSWQLNADWVMAAVVDFDDPTSDLAFIQQDRLKIFPPTPSPAADQITFRFEQSTPALARLEIYDQSGQIVNHASWGVIPAGKFERTIQITDLATGVYYYRIISGSTALNSIFSKQ